MKSLKFLQFLKCAKNAFYSAVGVREVKVSKFNTGNPLLKIYNVVHASIIHSKLTAKLLVSNRIQIKYKCVGFILLMQINVVGHVCVMQ